MKLYTFDPAPNPQRLKLFIDFKGLEIDTHQINFPEGEQRTDSYKAIIPTGTVPALVLDSGRVLTSVFAITHYLEAVNPSQPLLGSSAEEKAAVLDWNHRLFNEVFRATADVLRNTNPAFVGRALPGVLNTEQIPALAERGQAQLLQALNMFNHELASRPFLAGETFSMADIDLLVLLSFAGWAAKTKPDESLTALIAWRASAQSVLDAATSP